MESNEYLRVGKIVSTHGIQGEVRVLSDTDFPDVRFQPGKQLFLLHSTLSHPMLLTIKKSRPHKNLFVIKFAEWDSINTAEVYRNGNLVVLRTDLAPVSQAEGEYYYHDIVGCNVVTTDGMDKGSVVEVLSYPANDIWVCRYQGKEWLLPYIQDIVKEVDITNKQILIQWMEGMG